MLQWNFHFHWCSERSCQSFRRMSEVQKLYDWRAIVDERPCFCYSTWAFLRRLGFKSSHFRSRRFREASTRSSRRQHSVWRVLQRMQKSQWQEVLDQLLLFDNPLRKERHLLEGSRRSITQTHRAPIRSMHAQFVWQKRSRGSIQSTDSRPTHGLRSILFRWETGEGTWILVFYVSAHGQCRNNETLFRLFLTLTVVIVASATVVEFFREREIGMSAVNEQAYSRNIAFFLPI